MGMNGHSQKTVLAPDSRKGANVRHAADLRRGETLRPFPKPQLAELMGATRDAGAAGFALAQIPAGKPVLWVQDRMCAEEMGRPYGQGLERFGADRHKLIAVCASDAAGVLWAMEEGLKCSALAAVIGEIWGDPAALDFTATKRLAMRSERTGIQVFLIRFAAGSSLSAARSRWRVTSSISAPHPYDPQAPGVPRWRAELFRARDSRPGLWEAGYDAKAHRLDLSSPLRDPALEEPPLRYSRAG
ncbi:ImuA family protein [Oricola cellulosilytica]|nr:hypothetical protein [Oricola cellulosilytica]